MAAQRFVLPLSRQRAVAAAASVDPRTIRRYLAGLSVASLCLERIERALGNAGLAHLIRRAPPAATASERAPDAATLRRLAVAHDIDPRSILRELREPGSVRGMAGDRAREAIRELQQSTHPTKPTGETS